MFYVRNMYSQNTTAIFLNVTKLTVIQYWELSKRLRRFFRNQTQTSESRIVLAIRLKDAYNALFRALLTNIERKLLQLRLHLLPQRLGHSPGATLNANYFSFDFIYFVNVWGIVLERKRTCRHIFLTRHILQQWIYL